MSIINQMLKDLERRRAERASPQQAPLQRTQIAKEIFFDKKIMLTLLTTLTVFSLIALFTTLYFFREKQQSRIVVAPTSVVAVAPVIPQPTAPNAKPPIQINSVASMVSDDNFEIQLGLTEQTLYQINRSGNNLEISLNHVNLATNFSALALPNEFVESIATRDQNDLLLLTFKLKDQVVLNEVKLQGATNPHLVLDLQKPQAESSEPQSQSQMIKQQAAISPQELAQQELSKALDMVDAGQYSQAIVVLNQVLTLAPNLDQARETLAKLFLEQGNYENAELTLQQGMQINSNYLPYVKLQARVLMQQHKDQQALALMLQKKPEIVDDLEYYSLVAALYQRTNQFAASAQLYQQLLNYEPDNGIWLAGLGVSLEATGKNNEAKQAYLNAEKSHNLSPQLRSYINERLQYLA